MKTFIFLIAILFFNFVFASPGKPKPGDKISSECVTDLANYIGIKEGETLHFDQNSNDDSVSCNITVAYTKGTLTFDFGFTEEQRLVVISDSMQSNNDYFLETECSIEKNPGPSYGSIVASPTDRAIINQTTIN